MGALENYGLKKMTSGQAGVLGKFILSKAAKIIPPGSGRVAVEKIINSEVKNIFAKGGDSTPDNVPELEICNQMGTQIVFDVGGGKIQSSSWLKSQ